MLPKRGNHLPKLKSGVAAEQFAATIGQALKGELGTSRNTAKTIMRWTGASERSVKNWLGGTHSPSGWHLVLLAQESDSVMAALLMLAGRELNVSALTLGALRSGLMGAVDAIDDAINASP